MRIHLMAADRSRLGRKRKIDAETTHMLSQGRSNAAIALNQATGNLTIVGGLAGGSGAARYPTTALRYNLRTKVASELAFGTAFTWSTGLAIGATMFALDGFTSNYNANFYQFALEGALGTTLKASLSTPLRHSSMAVEYNNVIYRLGGWASTNALTARLDAYNISANSWSAKANMPIACNGHVGCAYNGKIFVFSGWDAALSRMIPGIQVYDIASNTWSFVDQPLATNAWGSGARYQNYFFYQRANVVDGKISIFRWNLDDLTRPPVEFLFDAVEDRWAGSTQIDVSAGKLHLIGGAIADPGVANYENLKRHASILTLSLATLIET